VLRKLLEVSEELASTHPGLPELNDLHQKIKASQIALKTIHKTYIYGVADALHAFRVAFDARNPHNPQNQATQATQAETQ